MNKDQINGRLRVMGATPDALTRFLGVLGGVKELDEMYEVKRDGDMIADLRPRVTQLVVERASIESPNRVWRDIRHYRPTEGVVVYMVLDEGPARPVEMGYWYMNQDDKPVWKYAENNQLVISPILYWAYERPGQDPALVQSRG